ncbi:MAG: hypothetical protein ABI840_10555 [bacterium]
MNKSEITLAIEPLIQTFEEIGISYYICGSIASSAFGISRTTQDIDFVSDISKASVEIFVEKLRDKYFIDADMIKDAIDTKTSFNLIHLETMMKIDIFILKDSLFHMKTNERKFKDKLDENENSIEIYLCSAEDIILSKLVWYVSGNEISERQWLDVIGVIKVQQQNLDLEYLNYWSKELNVERLLRKAFLECDLK